MSVRVCLCFQVGAIPANAVDDGQWSQGLISAVSLIPQMKEFFSFLFSLVSSECLGADAL